jgi:hypothetical protein
MSVHFPSCDHALRLLLVVRESGPLREKIHWSTRMAKSEACIPTISALSLHNASTKSLNANASTNQRVFEWPSSLDLDVRERALVSRPAVRMTSICSLRFRSLRRLRQTAHPRGWSRLRTIKRPRLGDAGLHNVEVLWRCCIILG